MTDIPIALGRVSELANRGVPERYDLTVVRGDSLGVVFRMYREVDACGDGSGVQTLTGLQGRMMLRAAPDYPVSHDLTVTVDDTAGSGRVTISADSTETRSLPETGVWDLELSDGTDDLRKTVLHGNWRILRDHTY